MHKPVDQAEFFTLLADLFCYMASGQSHIGYLSNNPGNKFIRAPYMVSIPSNKCLMIASGDVGLY